MDLLDVEGCYCFRSSDKSYRYIGKAQSQTIRQRLKQWERASYWLESSHIRIVIPKFKSQATKLERLLIMLHQPLENEKSGERGGNNPADKVIELINKEIQDLLIDG
jgi:excinuclease UvrABC nuclease subunit